MSNIMEIRRGNSVTITGTVTEADGSAVDLTEAKTLRLVLAPAWPVGADSATLIAPASDTGEGGFSVSLTAAQTRDLPTGGLWAALVIDYADGRRRQIPEAGGAMHVIVHVEFLNQ